MRRPLTSASLFAVILAGLAATVCAQSPPPASATSDEPLRTSPEATAPAQSLGRFFYSPEQRAKLDDMRKRPQQIVVTTTEQAPQPPTPEYVTLNGIVRRNDGTTTVWLNDRQVRGRETPEGLQISPQRRTSTPNQVTVRVPQTGHVIDLKVGQQLEVNSGTVKESYRAPHRSKPPVPVASNTALTEPLRQRERPTTRERDALRDLLRELDRPVSDAPPKAAPGSAAGTDIR